MKRVGRFVAVLMLAFLPVFGTRAQQSSETSGLVLIPVDFSMPAAQVMLGRPFVLPDHLTPAFDFDAISATPVTEADAREALQRFLTLRGLPLDRIEHALAQFEDPALATVIPAPNLRAALLMLTDWVPYQATINAILSGANETGFAFEAVDFRPLDFGAAIATLQIAYSTGRPRMLVSDTYKNESPQQLIPVLVHESLHDGVDNSFEEEIIASLLDSLSYAEVLSIDPGAAQTGTELAAYNNVQLFALMNSIGRRGPGSVGIETSLDGDVYLGPGLEDFDADSIRAGIAGDGWYSQLPAGGSRGGAVLEALLARFHESENLVAPDRFSAQAIELIDRGIGLVLTPRRVRGLAIDLQLSIVAAPEQSYAPVELAPAADLLNARPFLPGDRTLFDLRSMVPNPAPLDTQFARAALRQALLEAGLASSDVSLNVAIYDDPALIALVPDPSLRAGLLMLNRDDRWASMVASAIDGSNGTGKPVHIEFAELPNAVPAVWESAGWGEAPVVWVNSMLNGDRPELLATAIAEGLLLESAANCPAQAIIAAAVSTALWANLVTADPSLSLAGTWGTITRNRDLLALLNSQPFDPGDPAAATVGLRLATGSGGDVLPSLLRDASSFVNYILTSPRAPRTNPAQSSTAPVALIELLRHIGIDQAAAVQTEQVDDVLLQRIDRQFTQLLPGDEATAAAGVLGLTLSAQG